MTREEVRKRLLDWIQYATDPERVPFMDEPCSDEEIILAMRIGADALSQPSLPSELDEAAERIVVSLVPTLGQKYEDGSYVQGTRDYFSRDELIGLVKAGAEWMAGQYEKIEGELVDWYSTSDGKDYCCGVKTIDSFEVPEGFIKEDEK